VDHSLTEIPCDPYELQADNTAEVNCVIVCVSGPDSIRTACGAELHESGGHVGRHTQDELNVPKTSC
jgi:hypothetical protein